MLRFFILGVILWRITAQEQSILEILKSDHEEIFSAEDQKTCEERATCIQCLQNSCMYYKALEALSLHGSICLGKGDEIPEGYFVHSSYEEENDCSALEIFAEADGITTTESVKECHPEWDCALCLSNDCYFYLALPQFSPSAHICTSESSPPMHYVIHTSVTNLDHCKNYFLPTTTQASNERKRNKGKGGKNKRQGYKLSTFTWIIISGSAILILLLAVMIGIYLKRKICVKRASVPFFPLNELAMDRSLYQVEEEAVRLNAPVDV